MSDEVSWNSVTTRMLYQIMGDCLFNNIFYLKNRRRRHTLKELQSLKQSMPSHWSLMTLKMSKYVDYIELVFWLLVCFYC